jgi:hypothetical protein
MTILFLIGNMEIPIRSASDLGLLVRETLAHGGGVYETGSRTTTGISRAVRSW